MDGLTDRRKKTHVLPNVLRALPDSQKLGTGGDLHLRIPMMTFIAFNCLKIPQITYTYLHF